MGEFSVNFFFFVDHYFVHHDATYLELMVWFFLRLYVCLWNAKLYTQLDSGNTTCPLIFCDYLCGIPKSWCVLYTQPHSGNITCSRPSLRRLCLAGIRLGVCIFCGPRNLAFLQMQYWNSNDQSHGNWDFWMFCR